MGARPIIHMKRPLHLKSVWQAPLCCVPWNACSLQELTVTCPPAGDLQLGRIVQRYSLWYPIFDILDAQNQVALQVVGPASWGCWCMGCCETCMDISFRIVNPANKQPIGSIVKKTDLNSLEGFARAMFTGTSMQEESGPGNADVTDADNFIATFPSDLDVKLKAMVLAMTHLIDYVFFERSNNNRNSNTVGPFS